MTIAVSGQGSTAEMILGVEKDKEWRDQSIRQIIYENSGVPRSQDRSSGGHDKGWEMNGT